MASIEDRPFFQPAANSPVICDLNTQTFTIRKFWKDQIVNPSADDVVIKARCDAITGIIMMKIRGYQRSEMDSDDPFIIYRAPADALECDICMNSECKYRVLLTGCQCMNSNNRLCSDCLLDLCHTAFNGVKEQMPPDADADAEAEEEPIECYKTGPSRFICCPFCKVEVLPF